MMDNLSFLSQLFSSRCKSTSLFFRFTIIHFFSPVLCGEVYQALSFLLVILFIAAMSMCLTLSFFVFLRQPADCGLQSFLWIQRRVRPHDLLDERGKIHRRIRRSHQRRRNQVFFGVLSVRNVAYPKSLFVVWFCFQNTFLIVSGNNFLSKGR